MAEGRNRTWRNEAGRVQAFFYFVDFCVINFIDTLTTACDEGNWMIQVSEVDRAE
jgi:hypothetical protein